LLAEAPGGRRQPRHQQDRRRHDAVVAPRNSLQTADHLFHNEPLSIVEMQGFDYATAPVVERLLLG